MTRKDPVRIGGASGFWGDTVAAAPQLVHAGQVDYLVMDYLAELTMSIMARQREADPRQGYATDFVEVTLRSVLGECRQRGIRIVTNAGGVNPLACRDAIQTLAAGLGFEVRVAVVLGDDVLERAEALRQAGCREMFSGAALPEQLMSANVYLGAAPIAAALAGGADIVLTGRCVDSALVLGILMHEFGWDNDDYDRLAAGALAGHIIECGAQATGGLFTDWERVPDWAHIGFPVLECYSDGSFIVQKPPATGGIVIPAVVAEQMLYEIGDPQAYLLPDVTADFSRVVMTQQGPDQVRVSGACGYPPTDSYKVSATYQDGWRAIASVCIIGADAVRKAERTAAAILERTREILQRLRLGDYSEVRSDILGAESSYGAHARAGSTREVVLRLAVRHPEKRALQLFLREISPAATGMAPGTTGSFGARPSAQPVVRLFSFLLPKPEIAPRVVADETEQTLPLPVPGGFDASRIVRPRFGPAVVAPAPCREVPLRRIAHARSGDKGDQSNIGVIARHPDFYPLLRAALDTEKVARYMAHLVQGRIERFDVPGIHAVNFVLHQALGGGGMASLRNDPLGKAYAQILLDIPIDAPIALLDAHAADGCSQ